MLTAYRLLSLALALAYAWLTWRYRRAWLQMPVFHIPDRFAPQTRISVIIAARNEAANIAHCLQSILNGDYPQQLLEILVVDDFSEDDTVAVVSQLAENYPAVIRLLRLADLPTAPDGPAFGKKRAIGHAVRQARGDLMVTTDADCVAPAAWLPALAALFETRRPKAIAGPVALHRDRGLLARFQALDVAGLMGVTGAGLALGWHRMGNGANLAYPKAVFEAVGGFADVDDRASGDDLFLLQKIARRWPGGVLFLKNNAATVCTEAKPTLRAFVQQRLRWGAKNAALPEWRVKWVLAVVFACCWCLLANALLACCTAGWGWLLLAQIALKAGADYALLHTMCGFFQRRDLLRWFWPAFVLHTGYIAAVGAGSLLVKTYTWKGRRLR